MGFFYVLDQVINTVVVEAHAVDQPFGFHQSEQARFVISRLRARGDGTDFNGAKAHRAQGINALAIFVQTGRQTQRIFKSQPHALHRFYRHMLAHQRGQRRAGNTT